MLTRHEVRAVIRQLDGPARLMALLLYGAGLCVLEAARLRIKDVDFAKNEIVARGCKGDRDRVTMTMLPGAVKSTWRGLGRAALGAAGTRMPAAPGAGSGCSWPRTCIVTATPGSGAVITCTNPCCNAL
jgi:hypothetical protein